MKFHSLLYAGMFSTTFLAVSPCLANTDPVSLLGYATGAHVMHVTTNDPQIDQIGGVIYSQIKNMRAIRGLRMTVLVPRTNDLKPAIVYVPGGGFTSADYEKFFEMRSALAKAGFVVAAAEYRVVPDRFPAPLEDGKAAVRYLRAHASDYGIDPKRIGVLGDSAGGWLSQLMATTGEEHLYDKGDYLDQSSAVQAAVSLYGISDVRNIGAGFPEEIQKIHSSPAVTEALLVNGPAFSTSPGGPVDADPSKALQAGSMGHLEGAKPPILLMHGSADHLVSPVQSKQFFEALKKHGDHVEYIIVEGAGHGDNRWYQPAIINQVVEWFKKNLGVPIKKNSERQGLNANL